MVATKVLQEHKGKDKAPAASIIKPSRENHDVTIPISPNGTGSLEEEVMALRARNKILKNTLQAIKETAENQIKKHYDLVWFARYKSRFPVHEARHRIENSSDLKEEVKKLNTADADYFHGIHTGLLAASRMFAEQADILHINDYVEVSTELLSAGAEHAKKIQESKEAFPRLAVETPPLC